MLLHLILAKRFRSDVESVVEIIRIGKKVGSLRKREKLKLKECKEQKAVEGKSGCTEDREGLRPKFSFLGFS